MSFSVESRVPFLDHRLVDFGFSLPDHEKINGAQTKSILRESMKDILPASIYNRKDKKGFATPGENKWLRGSLGWLLNINYSNLDFLEATRTKSVIEDYKKGNNKYSRLVWRLALLNYWVKNNA
jgi:asparagine synthase (glutamine-hydrolysing)